MGLKSSRVGSARLREVLASGRSARTRLFLAKALPGKVFLFSVAVPKRQVKTATGRNRVRRRCREAFRRAGGVTLGGAPLVDMVVSARPEAGTAPFSQLVDEAAELLRCYSK